MRTWRRRRRQSDEYDDDKCECKRDDEYNERDECDDDEYKRERDDECERERDDECKRDDKCKRDDCKRNDKWSDERNDNDEIVYKCDDCRCDWSWTRYYDKRLEKKIHKWLKFLRIKIS
jgi:hypothetical protein